MALQYNIEKLNTIFNSFNEQYNNELDKLNKIHLNDVKNYHNDLLKEISNDYNIQLKELKLKYKKKLEGRIISNSNEEEIIESINMFEKIKINNIDCFIENRENGKIYNNKTEIIGEVKNNNYILFDN